MGKRYIFSLSIISLLFISTSNLAAANVQDITLAEQCSFNGINYEQAVIFVEKLQSIVRVDDKKNLAELANYPLKIYKGYNGNNHIYFKINNKAVFLSHYDQIITRNVKASILKSNPNDIFCNYHGGMISGGTIWFNGSPLTFFEINF